MYTLYYIAGFAVLISFFTDREKTFKGLKVGWKKFSKILGTYLKLLIILSFILLISDQFIINYLGGQAPFIGMIMGLIIGSITMMPGFIAYPLAGILVSKGVNYMVVAAFITTLMLVGVATYPVEKEYFGIKATIWRNIAGFIISAMIAVATGVLYGEVLI
ncbi:conserved protein, permease-related [Halanaerobium saccharolyticum subsp. saccharolyticum DSM 6643]|jgi:uncharacterized membrane protein YraQ (UPF0718 family)|uniref:Conserved protein, permease-related n=1 Tax=Halanaerobium saccharolyticum subsp. saccharolyticum DSM 6643 TaxID=1293054 RepID=M5E4V7_9FIRM|nr:hypothetical protein [Halanaerobium saccharolyticum]CCU81073.1 conserved protein, permease-related [Halanaerobium saccharolyticum subsp. saccharolyticum DSM 6643]